MVHCIFIFVPQKPLPSSVLRCLAHLMSWDFHQACLRISRYCSYHLWSWSLAGRLISCDIAVVFIGTRNEKCIHFRYRIIAIGRANIFIGNTIILQYSNYHAFAEPRQYKGWSVVVRYCQIIIGYAACPSNIPIIYTQLNIYIYITSYIPIKISPSTGWFTSVLRPIIHPHRLACWNTEVYGPVPTTVRAATRSAIGSAHCQVPQGGQVAAFRENLGLSTGFYMAWRFMKI